MIVSSISTHIAKAKIEVALVSIIPTEIKNRILYIYFRYGSRLNLKYFEKEINFNFNQISR